MGEPELILFGAALLSYLSGSFPTSYLLGKIVYKINLFEHGSKNVGATNAYRVLGYKAGLTVLFVDMFKGALPVLLISKFLPGQYNPLGAGIAAIIGHTLSPFIRFKGGKGVATSTGVFLALAPKAVGCTFLVFMILVGITRYVSLGSILGSLLLPVFCYIFYPESIHLVMAGIALSLFITYKHKANIGRLIRGEENKIQLGKKSEND